MRILWLCAPILAVLGRSVPASDEAPSIGLLVEKNAELVERTALDLPLQELAVLNDGKSDRPVQFDLQPGLPVDLTYRLRAVATCEELVVTADARGLSAKQLPRVEVLVSTLSAQCGFQTVRSLVLKATSQPQQLDLPASAAQWVIIRLVTPAEATTLPIAEIDIRGHAGPPQSRYAFKEAPAKAFSVLSEVQKSVHVTVSDDEASLYHDAADGKLNDWSFAEAALLSNGIVDRAERRKHLKQIDRIAIEAETVVASAKTPHEKGEHLLEWLHQNVMSGGYEANQTDLATVLSTGKFNCVSSATLYNIVGWRLGLDLRGIEVPDHAFSILYVGSQHMDIETTNPQGFNPARDRRILERFKEQTGFQYIPDRHADKRREVTDTGLLALTCYNHGVTHTREEQYALALADYFRALSLDPEFPSAIQNTLSVFANWSHELSENGEREQAVRVVAAGLRLAPEDRTLLHNRKVIWQHWALAEIEGNRRDAALDVLTRAAQQVPDGGFDRMQAYVFIQPGQKLAENQQWEDALKLAGRGLEVVTEAARKELRDWRNNIYHRWCDTALNKDDFATAADVLELAMQAEPEERRFSANTAYVVQEWLRNTYESDGLADAEALLTKLAVRFEDIEGTQRVVEQFARRTTETLTEKEGIDDALAFVDRNAKLLREDVAGDLRRAIFDRRASALSDMLKWDQAIAVYTRGLKVLPDDGHLRNNLLATWDTWAGKFRKSGDWSDAAGIYAKALDSGIDNSNFASKIGYCVQELALSTLEADGPEAAEKHIQAWQKKRPDVGEVNNAALVYVQTLARQLQKDGKHEQALVAVDRCRTLLAETDHQRLIRVVCDTWSQTHVQKEEWKQAIDVYPKGLKSLPEDSHLRYNAVATWNRWAGTYIDQKKWEDAIKVYEQALEQFPEDGTLRNNLKYCQQQSGK